MDREASPPSARVDWAVRSLKYFASSAAPADSPPVYNRVGSLVGVAWLDAALSGPHIVREAENLRLVDQNFLSRSVNLDISLDLLGAHHRRQCLHYGEIRRSKRGASVPLTDRGSQELLWVPVTRLSRNLTSPIDVRSHNDQVVPRATQQEIIEVLDGAVYQILRLLLLTDKDPLAPRLQWVLQEAISRTIYAGHWIKPEQVESPSLGNDRDRKVVEQVWQAIDDRLVRPQWRLFLELLHRVSNDHFIVVGLDPDEAEHRLVFSGPDLPVDPNRPRAWWRGIPGSSVVNDEYVLRYQRELKTSLRSLHVTLTTDDDVSIRTAVMSLYRDDVTARSAASTLGEIAAIRRKNGDGTGIGTPNDALLDFELRERLGTAERLLARRRSQRARAMELLTTSAYQRHESPSAALSARLFFLRQGAAGRPQRTDRGAEIIGSDEIDAVSIDRPETISNLQRRLTETEIGRIAVVSDAARVNSAHTFWRADPEQLTTHWRSQSYRMDYRAVLADDSPSLTSQVAQLLFGLLLTVTFIWNALYDPFDVLGWEQGTLDAVDALVAVLLIVPGLLLSRLDIPRGDYVLVRLRASGRNLAYLGVVVTTILAVSVAAQVEDDAVVRRAFLWSALALATLLALSAASLIASFARSSSKRWAKAFAPNWLLLTGSSSKDRPSAEFTILSPAELEDTLAEDRTPDFAARAADFLLAENDKVSISILHIRRRVSLPDIVMEMRLEYEQRLDGIKIDSSSANSEDGAIDVWPEFGVSSGYAQGAMVCAVVRSYNQDLVESGENIKVGSPHYHTFVPRPTFEYDVSRSIDLYFGFCPPDIGGNLTGGMAELLHRCIAEVAGLTVARDAAIALCEAASSRPNGVAGGFATNPDVADTTLPRPAASPGVRFGVDIPNRSYGTTHEFLTKNIDIAKRLGADLWIRERQDARPNQWHPLVEQPWDVKGHDSSAEIRWLLPVTAVGPWRRGATSALVQLMQAEGYVIGGMSERTLEGHSVIHLWLVSEQGDLAGVGLKTDLHGDWSSARRWINNAGVVHDAGTSPSEPDDLLAGYQVSISSPISTGDKSGRLAMWAEWNTRHDHQSFDKVVEALSRSFKRWGIPDPEVEYLSSRHGPEDRVVGRCKLSFDPKTLPTIDSRPTDASPAKAIVDNLRTICREVGQDWLQLVRLELGPDAEAQLVWTETWQGRWSPVR